VGGLLIAMAWTAGAPTPAGAAFPSPQSIGLHPGDVPGFTAVSPSVDSFADPTNDYVRAWDSCAGSQPFIGNMGNGANVVSQVYGQGTDSFGTPTLSAASVVFYTGSGDAGDIVGSMELIASGAFRTCMATTLDANDRAQGLTVPAQPTTAQSASTQGLASEVLGSTVNGAVQLNGSTAFLLHQVLDVGGSTVTADSTFTALSALGFVTLLSTQSVNATFPDSLRLTTARLLESRMGVSLTPQPTPEPTPQPTTSPLGGHSPETWQMVGGPGPSGLGLMASDATGVLYINDVGQTWQFSNERWSQLQPGASPTGALLGMAYDEERNQVILVTGAAGSATTTWGWFSGDWHALQTAHALSARTAGAFGFDQTTGDVVVFGGKTATGQLLNDTWIWNGSDWSQASGGTAPSPRSGATAAWSPGLKGLLLYGGVGASPKPLGDMWLLANGSWQQVKLGGAPPDPLSPIAGTYQMLWEPGLSPARVSLVGWDAAGTWHDWSGDDGSYWLDRNTTASPPQDYTSLITRQLEPADYVFGFDATDKAIVAVEQEAGAAMNPTWAVTEPTWLLPGCQPPDSSCDGVSDSVKREYGLDPYSWSTADDGISDAWKLPSEAVTPIQGAGFAVDSSGQLLPVRDLIFGPYAPAAYRGGITGGLQTATAPLRPASAPLDIPTCLGDVGDNPPPLGGCVDSNGRITDQFSNFNYPPDLFHKDVYVEFDWEDCQFLTIHGLCPGDFGSDIGIRTDNNHHGPNLAGLRDVIEMFSQAPVHNPDGTTGINLNILINQSLAHAPSCAQANQDTSSTSDPLRVTPSTVIDYLDGMNGDSVSLSNGSSVSWQQYVQAMFSSEFGTAEETMDDLTFGWNLVAARAKVVRFVWSGHSTALPSTSSDCKPPGLGPLPPTGPNPAYDYSPFGDANPDGQDILMSLSIAWNCPPYAYGCFSTSVSVLPTPVPPIYPNASTHLSGDGGPSGHNTVYPVVDLLGFGGSGVSSWSTTSYPGLEQVWGRAFAHMLGVSLGLTDAQARNDPTAPAVVVGGHAEVRLPDTYATWNDLALAPRGAGKPSTSQARDTRLPDLSRMQICNPDLPAPTRDSNGALISPDDPCITIYRAPSDSAETAPVTPGTAAQVLAAPRLAGSPSVSTHATTLASSCSGATAPPGAFGITSAYADLTHGAQDVVFHVSFGPCAPTSPVSVQYATIDGTARAGLDYARTSGTIHFNSHNTNATISVPVLRPESGVRNLSIELFNPTGAPILVAGAIGVIALEHPFAVGASSGLAWWTWLLILLALTAIGAATIWVIRTRRVANPTVR